MKKTPVKIIATLLLCLFMFSMVDVINAHAITGNDNVGDSILSAVTPLTASEIATAWPQLPTATELYDARQCIVIDLSYAGKQMATNNGLPGALPDQNSPTTYNMSSAIVNCTSNDPIIDLGVIIQNDPHIWLEYNSSIWVEVPPSYLQTSVQPYATAVQQIMNARLPNATSPSENATSSSETPQTQSTWAAGEYDDPSQMGSDITGSLSYGEWTQNTLGSNSNDYTAVDVLSMYTCDGLWLQDAMMIGQSGFYIEDNVWVNEQVLPFSHYTPWTGNGWTPSLNTMYSLFIQKQGNEWDFGWDMAVFYQYPASSGDYITVGNQSNACVESNDFTQKDWSGFWTCIGGDTSSGGVLYCLPAIGFYYGGNWVPTYVGDNCPAAYAYTASAALYGWEPWPGGTGGGPPPNWSGTSFAITDPYSPYKEIFEVSYGGTAHQGTQLWSEGAWNGL
jgi:hypothetical protein